MNDSAIYHFAGKVKDLSRRQGGQRIALLLGGAVFGGGLFLAVKNEPQLLQNLRWGPAVLVLVLGVPLTMLANAFEFKLAGASMQRSIPFFQALKISVVASAANMLPLPGGLATRVIALKSYEVSFKDGIAVNFLFAFVWVAIAFLFAGFCLLSFDIWWKWVFLVIGAAAGGGSLIWARSRDISLYIFGLLSLQRLFMVFLGAFRIWWCLLALGIGAGYWQAAIFVVGGVIGSAVSIIPAGLGVREGISAGLAPIVGLSVASGFLAVALNRMLGLLILAPGALSIGLWQRKEKSI